MSKIDWRKDEYPFRYERVRFHIMNKTNEECILTNQLWHIPLWGEVYEETPLTINAHDEFDGHLRFYNPLRQIRGEFLMQVGNDIFELRFKEYRCNDIPHLYVRDSPKECRKAEKKPEICGHVAEGNIYRVTQLYSLIVGYESDYYFIIREKSEPDEQRIAEPGLIEKRYIEHTWQVAKVAQKIPSQLNFIAFDEESMDIHFINYSSRECVLTNHVSDAYLWNARTKTYELTPITLQPKKRFSGCLKCSKDKTIQENDIFLIQVGDDVFALKYGGKFALKPYIVNNIDQHFEDNTVEIENSHTRTIRYITRGAVHRITKIPYGTECFFLINDNIKPLEGDVMTINYSEETRYMYEFGDMYGELPSIKTPKSDSTKKSNCCVIL